MKKYLALFLLLWAFLAPATAQFNGCPPGFCGGAGNGGGGDAPQTTAFLARTSGLSANEIAAYKALINGMVADGTFQLLDALYIFATNNVTTAALNLISTNYTITQPGAGATFTPDTGWAGNATASVFLNTNFNPVTATTPNFTLNSASIGAYNRTSPGVNAGGLGINNSTNFSQMFYSGTTGTSNGTVNNATGFNFESAAGSNRSVATLTRTGPTSAASYMNGSTTPVATSVAASAAIPNLPFYIFGINQNGTSVAASNDQFSAAWFGGALTAAQAVAIHNRVNAYMTAFGVNVY